MANMMNTTAKETDMKGENKKSLISIFNALCTAMTKITNIEFDLNLIDNGDTKEINKISTIIHSLISSAENPIVALGNFQEQTGFDIAANLEEFNRIIMDEPEWCNARGFKPIAFTLYKHMLWLKNYEDCLLASSYSLSDWTNCGLKSESSHYLITAEEKIINHGFKHYFKIMLKQELKDNKNYQSTDNLFEIIINDD